MKYFFFITTLLMANFAACQSKPNQTTAAQTSATKTADANAAAAMLVAQPNIQILDVRTPEEWAGGVIKGAKKLNYQSPDFKAEVAKLDKKSPVIVYCAMGGRSAKASELMRTLGFTDVTNMSSGFEAWKNAGYPVE
jgi:rhodanese-related sulfurtransferase